MGIFSEIPRHSQMDVLKKLDIRDFVMFKQCSRETMEISKKFRHKLHLKVYSIHFFKDTFKFFTQEKGQWLDGQELECLSDEPVRLEITIFWVHDNISNESFAYLEEFCQRTKVTVEELYVGCDSNQLPINTSTTDNLIKIKKLIFEKGTMEDADFIQLEQPEIYLIQKPPVLAAFALNTFFKQWSENKRQIIHFSSEFKWNLEELFRDFEITNLWPSKSEEWKNRFQLPSTFGQGRKLLNVSTVERIMDKKKLFILISENQLSQQFIDVCESRK